MLCSQFLPQKGVTPLHLAAGSGRDAMTTWLTEICGADVNAVDEAGNTPLHEAARSGAKDVVAYLVEIGAADPTATNKVRSAQCMGVQLCFVRDAACVRMQNGQTPYGVAEGLAKGYLRPVGCAC